MDLFELGRYLRESREARELTTEDAEGALKIRRRILESFEAGEFKPEGLSSVQIRGFIRNYARYLGLDSDKIIDYYDVALVEANNPRHKEKKQKPKATRQKAAPVPAPRARQSATDTDPGLPAVPEEFVTMGEAAETRRRRQRNNINRTVVFLMALAAMSVIVFVTYELVQRPASLLEFEDLPNIIATETSTATYTPLPTSTAQQFAGQPTQSVHLTQVYNGQGVMVSVLMQQRTWLRVTADDQERFAGVAPPGAEVSVGVNEFINEVRLTAANADALLVTYNGEPQRSFGRRGQPVEVVFRPDGAEIISSANFEPTSEFTATVPPTAQVDVGALIEAQTPTSTPGPSLTPSQTPPPTDTPPPTPTQTWTPNPTNTPVPTATEGPSPTPTLTATPTITLTPSETPFPTAVLPLRATSETVTPTKPPG